MNINVTVPDEDIKHMLNRAYQASSGWVSSIYMNHRDDWYITLRDSGRHINLDIERGLQMMYTLRAEQGCVGRGVLPSEWDEEEINIFIQYAAFGDIEYVKDSEVT